MRRGTKSKLTLRRMYVSVIETYIEDVKQTEKHVLDLLESITRPTFFLKEKLQLISFRMNQFGSQISKIKISTVGIPEISQIFEKIKNKLLF